MSRVAARFVWAAALLLCSCASVYELELPPDPAARSMILAVGEPACESGVCRHVRAYEGTAISESISAPNGSEVFVIYFSSTLAELGIAPGDLAVASGECTRGVRPIPIASSFHRGTIDLARVEFVEVDRLSESLEALRLPELDRGECLAGGGCFADEPAEDCETRQRTLRCVPCETPIAPEASDPPIAPAPPAIPSFVCPSGWDPRPWSGENVVCDPPSHPELTDCPQGQVQRFGEKACATFGAGPPAGEWNDQLGSAPVIYVRAGATGGDGSRAAPFGTLLEALAAATPQETIALSAGRFEVPGCTTFMQPIVGAWSSGTVIATTAACDHALRAAGTEPALREVTIAGGVQVSEGSALDLSTVAIEGTASHCLLALPGSTLSAEGVLLRGCPGAGLFALEANVALSDVFVRDVPIGFELARTTATITRAIVRGALIGAHATESSSLQVSSALIEGSTHSGLYVGRGSLLASEVVVRETANTTTVAAAVRLEDHPGEDTVLDLSRALIESTRGIGVLIVAPYARARATITDTVIRDVTTYATYGQAITVSGSSTALGRAAVVTLERVLLEDAERAAINADGHNLRLEGEDVVMLTAQREPLGMYATGTATIAVRRVGIAGPFRVAVGGYGDGSTVRVDDLYAAMIPTSTEAAVGVIANEGGLVRGARWFISGVRGAAVLAQGGTKPARIIAEDVDVRDLPFDEARPMSAFLAEGYLSLHGARATNVPFGLVVQPKGAADVGDLLLDQASTSRAESIGVNEGSIDATRVHITGAIGTAIRMFVPSHGHFEDLSIDRVEASYAVIRINGHPESGEHVVFRKTQLGGGDTAGFQACNTRVELTDLVVRNSRQAAVDVNGSDVNLSRFRIEDGQDAALFVRGECLMPGYPMIPATELRLRARDGLVRNNRVGIRVLLDRYDPAQAMVRVRFESNAAAIQRD
jgi:hypothetical protein